ncbi:MAG: DUF6669 family protein [Lachnospiraceae bacterium]
MNKIMCFSGSLTEGYIGNITYSFFLEKIYHSLKIELSYSNPKLINPSKELITKISFTYKAHYPTCTVVPFDDIYPSLKTELQLCAFLNNEFLGNSHSPSIPKIIFTSKNEASYGSIPKEAITGQLLIILNCFQVINDTTNYIITIFGEE